MHYDRPQPMHLLWISAWDARPGILVDLTLHMQFAVCKYYAQTMDIEKLVTTFSTYRQWRLLKMLSDNSPMKRPAQAIASAINY